MNEVKINKDIKLSEHFTLGEMTKTSYHTTDRNIPSHVAIENLRNICANWLEDLRYSYNALYGDSRVTREGQSPCNTVAGLPAHTGDIPVCHWTSPSLLTQASAQKKSIGSVEVRRGAIT